MQCCVWQSFDQAPLISGALTLPFSLVSQAHGTVSICEELTVFLGVLGSASSLEVET